MKKLVLQSLDTFTGETEINEVTIEAVNKLDGLLIEHIFNNLLPEPDEWFKCESFVKCNHDNTVGAFILRHVGTGHEAGYLISGVYSVVNL